MIKQLEYDIYEKIFKNKYIDSRMELKENNNKKLCSLFPIYDLLQISISISHSLHCFDLLLAFD